MTSVVNVVAGSVIVAAVVLLTFGVGPVSADVVQLDSTSFEKVIGEERFVIVNFCDSKERDCKKLGHEFAAAAEENESTGVQVKLAVVDCSKSDDICKKYNIASYPTIKTFESGTPKDIDASFKKDVITTFSRKFVEPPLVSELKSVDEVKDFIKTPSSVVVAFISSDDTDSADTLSAVASALGPKISFAFAPEGSLKEVFDGKLSGSAPTTLLYVPFQKSPIEFEGKDYTSDAIKAFINSESFPLVDTVSSSNYQDYVNRGLPFVWSFLSDAKLKDNIAILEKAAESTKGTLSWVYLDAGSSAMVNHAISMGLTGTQWPAMVIEDQVSKKKFIFPEDSDFTVKELSAFATKVLAGDIEPFMKSEPVPSDNAGALTTVVGKSYEDLVIKADKDVLLFIFAEWCGHCKRAKPYLQGVADVFDGVNDIVIASLNGEYNDVPLPVQGFPTIMFFGAGQKSSPISFENAPRTTVGFTKFILEQTQKVPADAHKTLLEKAKEIEEKIDQSDDDNESGRDEL